MDFRKVRVIIHYGLPITPAGEFKSERYTYYINNNLVIINVQEEQEELKMKELLYHYY